MLKRKKAAKLPSKKLDIRQFHRKTNWADLWEEWYLELGPSGLPKYKTIRHFAAEKATNSEELRFMVYYLGPAVNPDPEEVQRYPFVTPQDWKKKREDGGWYSEENIRALSKVISSKLNALEALSEAGDQVTLRVFTRIGSLFQQLDKSFQGRFFIANEKFVDNVARAEAYLRLYNKLLTMLGYAQDLFAKSRGINFDDMQGLAHIVTAAAQMSKQVGDTTSKYEKALSAIMQMTLQKSADYDLPLPKEMEEKIVDVVVEPPMPKKKVN